MGVNALVKKVLAEVGIKPERFNLQWASAAEAPRFVKLITEFTQKIKELGPIGQAEGLDAEEVKAKLKIALKLVNDRKVRMSFGTATRSIRKEGDFSQEHITEVIDSKLGSTINTGIIENGLLTALEQSGPVSLSKLLEQVGAPKADAEKILATLTKQGKVEQKGKKWALAAS